jgi:hypothetical protein
LSSPRKLETKHSNRKTKQNNKQNKQNSPTEKQNKTKQNKKEMNKKLYSERMNMLLPFPYYETGVNHMDTLRNRMKVMKTDLDTIHWYGYFFVDRTFEKLSKHEKHKYGESKSIYHNKYEELAKMEYMLRLVKFINSNFEDIFPLGFDEKENRIIIYRISVTIKLIFNSIRTYQLFETEFTRYIILKREFYMLKNKVQHAKRKQMSVYLSIFNNGSGKKVNSYDINRYIYKFLH